MRRMLFFAMGLLFISLLMNATALAFISIPEPVAYWLFDVEGDTVLDSSGNENHGEIKGELEWVEGQFGLAIAFPGRSDSYILVEDSESLNPVEQLSITCWANPADLGKSPRLVSKDHDSGGVGRDYGLQISSEWLWFGVWHPVGGRSEVETAQGAEIDQWQHFAGTYDGSVLILYVNGEEIDRTVGPGGMVDTDEPLVFGTFRGTLSQEPYTGVLDDVAIFDVALSPLEVKAVMEDGLRKLSAVNPSDKLTVTWGSIKNR